MATNQNQDLEFLDAPAPPPLPPMISVTKDGFTFTFPGEED